MSVLDPKWKYTHSTATDIRKTFAKARRALTKKQQANAQPPKLQLMCGPSERANVPSGNRPMKASLYSTRNNPPEQSLDQLTDDQATRLPGRSDRRIA